MFNAAALALVLATAAAPTTADKLQAVIALGADLPGRQEIDATANSLAKQSRAPDELLPALAAPVALAPNLNNEDNGIGSTVIKLWVPVFLLGFAAFILLRMKKQRGPGTAKSVSVQEVVSLGKGRQLMVVNVEGERILVGVSEGNMTVLKEGLASRLPVVTEKEKSAPLLPASTTAPLRNLLARFSSPTQPAAFESHLSIAAQRSCSEDDELRQRLALRLNEKSL